MAKIKKEEPVENAIVESTQEMETTQETTEKKEETQETTEKKEEIIEDIKQDAPKEDGKKTQAVETQDIPENVKRILVTFRNMPELYVSKSGSVYTPDTKPSVRGNAILYKNPFYNSKS